MLPKAFFFDGMTRAIQQPGGPGASCISSHHLLRFQTIRHHRRVWNITAPGGKHFLQLFCDSGFAITGTWPLCVASSQVASGV
jgi:hypothetical protein